MAAGSSSDLRAWTSEELRETFSELRPPTHDDVSITADGRRLDSIEKVRAFLAELDDLRAADSSSVS